MKLLNLGCGSTFHSDWVNVNFFSTGVGVITHDLRKKFPWKDESFDIIYHSHVLEHFNTEEASSFIKECYRVLKKKGIMRVVVPDLEQITLQYIKLLKDSRKGVPLSEDKYEWIMLEFFDQVQRNNPGGETIKFWDRKDLKIEKYISERVGSEFLDYIRKDQKIQIEKNIRLRILFFSSITLLRNIFKDALLRLLGYSLEMAEIGKFRLSGEVHYKMYDSFSLSKLLQTHGFKSLKICNATESEIPKFRKYMLDVETDGKTRKPDSLFIECKK